MTNKRYFWSYQDVTDFLSANDFNFMEGVDGDKGAWVKLNDKGEPYAMIELRFKTTHYSKREINRIVHLSKIAEKTWVDWFEARLSEAGP